MRLSLSDLQIRTLLLDIEGTTTPIAFVYGILFPYARAHAAGYLEREWASPPCRAAVAQLREEREADLAAGDLPIEDPAFDPPAVFRYVSWLMDRDRKSSGLKALQGLIWREGFEAGQLRGQVYDDVLPAFARWRASGRDVFIYSSGSVLAQQLLFGWSESGDLRPFLSGYFDTAVGPKNGADSYRAIAVRIGVPAGRLLFVSDVPAELDAARAAGCATVLCLRGGSASHAHPTIHSFDEISD